MNINILTYSGIPLVLDMKENSVLIDLKNRINSYYGISSTEQTLLFEDNVINNDMELLSKFGMRNGSVVKLIINFKKEKFVLFFEMQGNLCFETEVLSKDSIIDVKKRIKSQCKLSPDEQIWVFQGRILEGNKNILNYGLEDKSTVHILEKLLDKIKIICKTLDGKTFPLNILKSNTMLELKVEIFKQIQILPAEQKLIHHGCILDDEYETVEDREMVENDVINIVIKRRLSIEILVRTVEGNIEKIEVLNTDNILNLKKKIEEKMGILVMEQKLVYCGTVLGDETTVKESEIVDNSVVYVVTMARGTIEISVRTKLGKIIHLHVTKTDRIKNIRKKIEQNSKILMKDDELVFHGHVLGDDQTVGESNIVEKSVVDIVESFGIQILVKVELKVYAVKVKKTNTLKDIKNKVQEKVQMSLDNVGFQYQGNLLYNDQLTVGECEFEENCMIEIYL